MVLFETNLCPKCGKPGLVHDGRLAWRSGPRPPRALARMDVNFLPRADYEQEELYHCKQCSAEFYEDVEQRRTIHLYEEGVSGRYVFNKAACTWQYEAR